MRKAFVSALMELAEKDPRVMLLTADLGFMILEPFMERFPDRFFNVGVAEQNMVGMATGLAEGGMIPFVYTIVTFAALRPFEFIRNGPVLHQFPVRVVGVGGGLEYARDGASHFGLEDVGVLRTQPGLAVFAPADAQQAKSAVLASANIPGPVYFRLGKDENLKVPGLDGRFEPGRLQVAREGKDLLIVTMGSIAPEAALAIDALAEKGISVGHAVLASVSPAPYVDLAREVARYPLVATIENHYTTGGGGSLVAEAIADSGAGCRLLRCGVDRLPDGISGHMPFMYEHFGVSTRALIEKLTKFVYGDARR